MQKELYDEIDRMLSLDVIEESLGSLWSSPGTLMRKSNGKVNSKTKKDAFPSPLIEGVLSRLPDTKYITSLGESSRDKTAFTVIGRPFYLFKVMPFGLCNAAQSMCRLIYKVIPHTRTSR